jgi:HK97 family phage prohead protease
MNLLEKILERQGRIPYLGSGFAVCLGETAGYSGTGTGLDSSDGKEMTARFLITTPTKDRHGDVVIPDGCRDYIGEYERNPVVLLNHNQDGMPIATSTLEFAGRGIVATAKFHGKTRESDEAFALVDCGVLRGCSIGFNPKEAEIHEGKLEQLEDGGVVKFEPYISFTFLKWALLEWSVVAVPANAEAVRLSLEKGVGGRPLSDSLRQYLEPMAESKKVWSPGATLKSEAPAERRSPKKPGEQFISHVVRTLGGLGRYCQETAAELDHPGVSDLAMKAAEQFHGLKATYQEKGAKHYPDVDFEKSEEQAPPAPATELVEPVVSVADKSLDTDAITQAINHLVRMQEQTDRRLRRATGR